MFLLTLQPLTEAYRVFILCTWRHKYWLAGKYSNEIHLIKDLASTSPVLKAHYARIVPSYLFDIISIATLSEFKTALKTHLFGLALLAI